MTPHAFFPLVCFITFLALGLFVLFHKPCTSTKTVFSLLCFEAFYWQVVWFVSFFTSDPVYLDYLAKISYLAITFLPFTFYHFIVTYLKINKEKPFVLIFYGLAFLLGLLLPTDLFVKGHRHFYWGNFAAPGQLYPLFTISGLVAMIRGIIILKKAIKKPAEYGLSRNQIYYIFLGLGLYFFCAVDFAQIYGATWYPLGVFFFLASFFVISYAILRHRVMDIEVIIKKTLVFAGLFALIAMAVAAIVYVLNPYVTERLGVSGKVFNVIAIVAVMFLYDPTKRLLINLTDRFLFQKKVNYRTLLREATEFLAHVRKLDSQAQKIVEFLTGKARLASAYLYLASDDSFFLKAGEPLKGLERIDSSHSLIHYFKEHHAPLERQSLKDGEIFVLMKDLKAQAAIPCFSGETLIAILFLGHQKSDEPYSDEDLDVFFTLGQECSIAFENSRLYDEALQKTKELQATQASLIAAEKTATMVGMAKALGHEVNNPLATVVARAGFIYKEELKDLKRIITAEAKSFLPLEILEKIENKLEKINDNAQRIDRSGKRIEVAVRTLTNILKDTKGEQGPQNFRVLWREALEASRFSTFDLSNCQFEENIEPNLIVHGNNEQLIQVFANLIKNSYEAMPEGSRCVITITADKDSQDPKMAKIEFSDNGPGIDPLIQHKIWNQGFSTKPSSNHNPSLGETGQGQGLYVCKHLVESIHKGTITVTNEAGRGTTFIIRLPLSKESQDG